MVKIFITRLEMQKLLVSPLFVYLTFFYSILRNKAYENAYKIFQKRGFYIFVIWYCITVIEHQVFLPAHVYDERFQDLSSLYALQEKAIAISSKFKAKATI